MKDNSAIIRRLRRIEGQIKGIQKMVEEEKFCGDILVQIAAARSALNNAGGLILENYMKNCLLQYIEGDSTTEDLDKLVDVLLKYSKQN
ncbi:MAG TPA: metal-sensitive transcriptional regulator [Tissierellaceae bacterium]|nr:metal-sensitive transcriptional regulator [Tissierellaceae bacterium]